MPLLRSSFLLLLGLFLYTTGNAQAQNAPHAEISNGLLHAGIYLPDATAGFYRGTRFDWSGVIHSLTYNGHDYYGPWFTKTDRTVIDFVFRGADIVAGPCSAITGPVEEFSTDEKALGYDEAKVGGTFIKIGVGVLRRPDDKAYNNYRLYEIVDPGKWAVRTSGDSVEFIQTVSDPSTGYGYTYTKVIRLIKGKPEMVIEHSLQNTGRRRIESNVFDHNFLVLDKQTVGPDFTISVPFQIKTETPPDRKLAEVRGNQFIYKKLLSGRDTVAADFSGFDRSPADYKIRIENAKVGAGMTIAGDRPLSQESLWSIRSVLAMEPFIDMSIEPGKKFSWKYTYSYFGL
jgi:hypothetical protein